MAEVTDTLAVRALNHWRRIDDVSYLGLRLYLEPLRHNWSGWERSVHWAAAQRKAKTRYQEIVRLKHLSIDGQRTYRTFLAGSPSTAIAEARTLSILTERAGYRVAPNVYSYRAPGGGAGRSYHYYRDLYLERSAHVEEQLRAQEDPQVLVLDIENFYPSVATDELPLRTAEILTRADVGPSDRALAQHTIEGYLHASRALGVGLAIGPAVSHLLANVALEKVDQELSEAFGLRYTRYVDDFAIVVTKAKLKQAEAVVSAVLEEQGLSLNKDKSDAVSAAQWRTEAPSASDVSFRPFESLWLRLGAFVARRPESRLDIRMRDVDARVPLAAMRTQMHYHRYQLGFLRFAFANRKIARELYSDNEGRLTEAVLRARARIGTLYAGVGLPSTWGSVPRTVRRWRLSRLRRVIWWGYQLWPMERIQAVARQCLAEVGLCDLGYVGRSLQGRGLDQLMSLPGTPVSMALSLARSGNQELTPDWITLEPTKAIVESATSFACRHAVYPPADWADTKSRAMLLDRLRGDAPKRRQDPTLTYTDELDSILLGSANEDFQMTMMTRSSLDETPSFDIADLLGRS